MITSIRSRRLFGELRTNGSRVRSGAVRMTYLPLVTSSGPQIAFALSKRFGNAVERNRGRRRLRSAFTEAWANDAIARPQPGAFLLTGNRGLLSSAYPELVADVARCLSQLANENKGGQR